VNAIARNCLADHYRTSAQHIPLEDAPEAALDADDNHAARIADADLLQYLLGFLCEEDRVIVHMKYFEGLSNVEIANELDMNPSTVGTRIHRALASMRAALDAST